jgi:hypothetical protein
MKTIFRRGAAALGAVATAATGAVVAAPAAYADAEACIAQLVGPAANTDRLIVYPAEQARIRLTTSAYTNKTCYEHGVAIGSAVRMPGPGGRRRVLGRRPRGRGR